MPETPNHGYNVPNEGDEDWHVPLNENFRQYDTDIEIRDTTDNRDEYEPKAGAKFLAIDDHERMALPNGNVWIGDGDRWVEVPTTGPYPYFERVEILQDLTVRDIECRGDISVSGSGGGAAAEVTGNVGEPALVVTGSVSGTATSANHVATIKNISDGNSDDVLSLVMDEDPPGSGNNYISFKDADDEPVGAIEGDGSGGVTVASQGKDYAEWLPRQDPSEAISPGQVVGVHGGRVTKTTADADRAMVVSAQPIVTGGDPGQASGRRSRYETVAFVGQVPTKVRGSVTEGDFIVPSGEHDGVGRAVAPADYDPREELFVGQAWEGTETDGVEAVTVAVGLEAGEALAMTVARQHERLDSLAAETRRKADRIDRLEQRLQRLDARMNALETNGTTAIQADD